MPVDRYFIDSNTFLYTFDKFELSKGRMAQSWLRSLTECDARVTNLQVLDEIANVVICKADRFSDTDPFLLVDAFASFGPRR